MAHFAEKEQTSIAEVLNNLPGLQNNQLVSVDNALEITPVDVDATGGEAPLTGIYSNSGFDMVGVLSKLVNR
jgi:hypothetical protein